jgi:hypothetical protein
MLWMVASPLAYQNWRKKTFNVAKPNRLLKENTFDSMIYKLNYLKKYITHKHASLYYCETKFVFIYF